jgi:hypothetical protein
MRQLWLALTLALTLTLACGGCGLPVSNADFAEDIDGLPRFTFSFDPERPRPGERVELRVDLHIPSDMLRLWDGSHLNFRLFTTAGELELILAGAYGDGSGYGIWSWTPPADATSARLTAYTERRGGVSVTRKVFFD